MIALEISELHYSYPDGTEALSGVSLRLDKGKILGILGPNGAGKSTLMLHLNGILTGKGSINVMGMAVSAENIKKIRRSVGLVFQDPDDQLFLASVYDDVAFGPLNLEMSPDEIEEAVGNALTVVGMAQYSHKSAHHLSFGQKKLVALATVLSMNPEILVLDEPSSNLDPRARRSMIELLKGMNVTMLISTHDMNLAWELCDEVIIMNDGKIVHRGVAGDALVDDGMLTVNGLERPSLAHDDGCANSDKGE